MAWRRKQTRYAFGSAAENELRKILSLYLMANCRSSRSGGLFDVWAVGSHLWLFQVKRGLITRAHAVRLLRNLNAAVGLPDAHIFVANRTNLRGRIRWVFYSLNQDH